MRRKEEMAVLSLTSQGLALILNKCTISRMKFITCEIHTYEEGRVEFSMEVKSSKPPPFQKASMTGMKVIDYPRDSKDPFYTLELHFAIMYIREPLVELQRVTKEA